jgi:hypothetical protein
MNTLANVGTTSNCLWWALNCVSLLFACSKYGTTARESPYTDMILLLTFLRNQDDSMMDLTELDVAMGSLLFPDQ